MKIEDLNPANRSKLSLPNRPKSVVQRSKLVVVGTGCRGLFAISEGILGTQLDAIRASPFFSLLLDSSSDVGGEDHLLFYVQYLCPEDFVVKVEYLCAVRMITGSAPVIFSLIKKVINVLGLRTKKLAAFCSDGASVFTGRHNGVAKQLRDKICSFIVNVHCAAHRCALVLVGASKTIPELESVDHLLKSVAKLFRKSPKEFGRWEAYAKAHGLKAVKFPKFCHTRWASRADCIKVLITNLHVLMQYLEGRHGWSKVDAVMAQLRNIDTLCLLFALHDILHVMNMLSLTFQVKGVLPHHIWPAVCKTKKQLKYFLGDDDSITCPSLRKFLEQLVRKKKKGIRWMQWNPLGCENPMKLSGMYDEARLYGCLAALIKFISKDLTIRFRDCKTITAFRIFDPTAYEDVKTVLGLQTFGMHDFDTLLTHYVGQDKLFVCDRNLMEQEFYAMKRSLYDFIRLGRNTELSFQEAWKRVAKADGHLFPHMLILVQVMCVIPTHTCDVERGFSQHRLIKHRLTSRLRVVTVDSMMRVKLNARDGLDGIKISSANSCADSLDEVVTPLLKKFFGEVNDISLPDQPVHDFEQAEYDEDYQISDDDGDNDDVAFEEVDEEEDA